MKEKLRTVLLGQRLKDSDIGEEKFSVLWGIPIFASDAISSVSYAGEEILLVLIPVLGMLSFKYFLPIVAAIICLLGILIFCYRQTIEAYPQGGGAYIVASENLGEKIGLIAGASLIMDYILTVAVSSCAGAAAITSAFPAVLPYKPFIAFALICLLTWGNLRGIRESSVIFGIPTYLFILTMFSLLVTGVVKYLNGTYTPAEMTVAVDNSKDVLFFVLLKAFASGCTALTGVEAVSNGVPNFRDPAPRHAKKVLIAMAGFVCVIFFGVSLLISWYKIVPNEHVTAVSQLAGAVFGQGSAMYFVVQTMTVIILALAANTAFADLPLLMALIAQHGYLPRKMVERGTRLNFSNGILVLFGAASLLVFIFKGSQHLLLPLYASGVFISFFLSQFGMFFHWKKQKGNHWKLKAAVNAFGTVITGVTLAIIVCMKFKGGAWVAILCISLLLFIMSMIKRHYTSVASDLYISEDEAIQLIQSEKSAKIMLPVQSVSRSFIKTVNSAMSCGLKDIELYHVCSDESEALALKEKIEKLGLDADFVYDVTYYRNFNEVMVNHIQAESEKLSKGQTLIVMLGSLVVKNPLDRLLHNGTTQRLTKKLEKNKNVSVFTVPYII